MSRLKKLIAEIHRRSLWQVLAIYLASAAVGYQLIEALVSGLGLPEWLPAFAVVLLIVGLPIVLATAFIQEGINPPAHTHEDPTLLPDTELGGLIVSSAAQERRSEIRRVLTWRNAILGGVLAFGLWGLVATGLLVLRDRGDGTAEVGDREEMVLVVLPFENLGPSEDEYFADGITEEITSRLASIHGLGIIARTSAILYKQTEKSIREIGEELGVDYVLEGTVRWQGGAAAPSRVRVTPQLIRVPDATHLWSDRYDAELGDIFEIQSDIAENVAQALEIALLTPEKRVVDRRPTDNLEAYDYYLRGQSYIGGRKLKAEFYERAVQLDPQFALAHARLSESYTWMYWQYTDRSEERLAMARDAAYEALRLDPDLAEAHIALGTYYYLGLGDYERALQEYQTAQVLRPGEPISFVGYVQRRLGRWEEAAVNIERWTRLAPGSAGHNWDLALTYCLMREYEPCERWLDRSMTLDPVDFTPYGIMAALYMMRDGGDVLKFLQKEAA